MGASFSTLTKVSYKSFIPVVNDELMKGTGAAAGGGEVQQNIHYIFTAKPKSGAKFSLEVLSQEAQGVPKETLLNFVKHSRVLDHHWVDECLK